MDIDTMHRQVRDLMAFKDRVEGGEARPSHVVDMTVRADTSEMSEMLSDFTSALDEIKAFMIRAEPLLEWIEEQMTKTTAPANPDKPLEHIAEVEASLG